MILQSVLVQGTLNLIKDISIFLTILSPITGVVCFTYCIIRKGGADPQDQPSWQKRATTAIICGVAGLLGSSLITLLASYYGTTL